MTDLEEPKSNDPFHPDNVAAVQLITLMRIYDVLMGIYHETEPRKAKHLFQWHEAGKIAGPLPWFAAVEGEDV